MKKTIYIILFLICGYLSGNLHAQGLYKQNEVPKQQTNSKEYSPTILRGEPDLPPPPGEDELPVSEGVILLVGMAMLAGARSVVRNVTQ